MRYISTRHGSQGNPAPLGFEDVMLAGLARDGGLYLPAEWPQFSKAEIAALKGLPYGEVAFRVMRPFVGDAFDEATFRRLIGEAYASFETPEVAPLKPLGDSGLHLLELFHGPTLAFKDVALQLLGPHARPHADAPSGQHATIVGATSGDTGSAAIEAVRDRKTIDIFMLHPRGRVSEVQRRQMTTVLAPNVHNIAVAGTFDDCQDLAKACFNDLAFRDRHALTAVNSINFARVMAQIVYYFWAALKLGAPERPVAFTVPTGNFGNVYAGYAAQRMGLPIHHFVVAANTNDILARFFETGRHDDDRRRADLQPQHGHPDLEQLRAPAVRPLRPRRQGAGRGDGRVPSHRHAQGRRQCAGRRARPVRCRPPGRRGHAGRHRRLPPPLRRDDRSAHRRGLRRGPAASPRSEGSHGRAGDRPSRQVPRCRGQGDRRAAAPAGPAGRPDGAGGAGRWAAQRPCRA